MRFSIGRKGKIMETQKYRIKRVQVDFQRYISASKSVEIQDMSLHLRKLRKI